MAIDTLTGDLVMVDRLHRFPARREVACAAVISGGDVRARLADGKRGVVVTIGATPDDFVVVDSDKGVPRGSRVARAALIARGDMSRRLTGNTRFGSVTRSANVAQYLRVVDFR